MPRASRTKKAARPAARPAASRKRVSRPRLVPRTAAESSEFERVRNLIALDAVRLVARVDRRSDEMIALFSRHRDREPLLAPLRSWLSSASFSHLALLSTSQQAAVSLFLEELEALRWYFRYTDDMPSAAQQKLRSHRRRLTSACEQLIAAIGPALEAGALPPELS